MGKFKNIIEENKADMGSLAMLDYLTELGMYSELERKQIIVTYAADNFLKAKPDFSQAHRVRTVMQSYYFFKEKAIWLNNDGVLEINIDKMVLTAQKMLAEIVRVQLSRDFAAGEKYVKENFVWTDEMEVIAKKLKEIDKSLNGTVESPLAELLIK